MFRDSVVRIHNCHHMVEKCRFACGATTIWDTNEGIKAQPTQCLAAARWGGGGLGVTSACQ